MKRFSCLIALAVMVVTPYAHAAEGGGSGTRIRSIETESFPSVTLTTSVNSQRPLQASDVSVIEDGTELTGITVQPLSEGDRSVDIVLVIDTSGSMEGEPIASAVAAALRFVTSLPDEISAGIVTFSDRPRVVQPITRDHSKLLQSLGGLEATGETSLYDGIKRAASMFSEEAQHNLVILSDGADTSSHATLRQATGAAKHADASVFTVGLTSGEFDAAALKSLAAATDGTYAPAATARLSSVYQQLATELTNQYLITYRSRHRDGGETEIRVTAAGASDGALVLTPNIEPPAGKAAPPPAEPSAFMKAVSGPAGLAIALGSCFLSIFVLMVMVLGTGARKRRDRELARRTSATARSSSTETPDDGWVPDSLVLAAERAGRLGGLSGRLDHKLERAGMPLRTGEFIVGLVVAAILGTVIGALLVKSVLFAMLLSVVGASLPYIWLAFVVRRRLAKLHSQLADILMILANALRAGHSFMQALDLVAQEIGEPAGEEFGRLVAEVRLGRPVDESLAALADRLDSEDFKWALLAVNIQREVGGNLAEVLDTVSETIRERDGIRRQIDVLTAEGRLSVWILAGLPVVVALYMAWVNPEYLALLFNNGLGLLMTIVATCLLTVGIFWMKKVVKIDV